MSSQKPVRAMNQPKNLSIEEAIPLTSSEVNGIDNILEHLFEFFMIRSFRMTSEDGHPKMISLLTDNPDEYQYIETLDELKTAGPAYVKYFYDFITEYVGKII